MLDLCSPGFLEGMRELQDSSFSERLTEDLQAHGQAFGRSATGNGDAGHSYQ